MERTGHYQLDVHLATLRMAQVDRFELGYWMAGHWVAGHWVAGHWVAGFRLLLRFGSRRRSSR
ncbi:hypothetical protein FRAAL4152 [Frankia alni ACN14a]|uniref:Uncharacterized protein n=1 Tax=Frankia alni (strain DSM 45986 / CECT 9034 / ACN14a) TaxID=326424 RepID=Q0RI77_FRAAA|nr:hypothetical protein FRAAL4152 [Frankia alni ACN14a]